MSDVWFSSIFKDELQEDNDEERILSDLSYYYPEERLDLTPEDKHSLTQSSHERTEGDENKTFLEKFSSWRSDISGLNVDTDGEVSSYFEELQEIYNKMTLDNSNPPDLQVETTQDFILDMDSNMMCRPGEEFFDTASTEKECESIYQELLLGHNDNPCSLKTINRLPSLSSSRSICKTNSKKLCSAVTAINPMRKFKGIRNNTNTSDPLSTSSSSSSTPPPPPPPSSLLSPTKTKKTNTDSKTVKLQEEEKKSSSKTLKPVTGVLMPLTYFKNFNLQPTIRLLRLRLPLRPTNSCTSTVTTTTTGGKKSKKVLKDEKRKCSYWKSILDKEKCSKLSSAAKSKVKSSKGNPKTKSSSKQKRKSVEKTKQLKQVKAVKTNSNNNNSKKNSLRPRRT